ncbi:MAG: YeeE/YedE family protein [Pseudomonadales bacterium]|nr:YeeE/YedE family protein [Pseudomonadales bacterium]
MLNPTNNRYLSMFSTFTCGLLFAVGLQLAAMTHPSKIQGFLNVSGLWDPSLALVLFAATGIFSLGFWSIIKARINNQKSPILASSFQIPTATLIDKQLIIGSVIFGIGWGLSGFCPGPAIANLIYLDIKIFAFIIAMLLGMAIAKRLKKQ